MASLSSWNAHDDGPLQVPLIWWPWWPFNPADVYLNSVLPLERMLREAVIDNQVRLVPVLDGLQPPRFYEWWFAPLSQQPVSQFINEIGRSQLNLREIFQGVDT